MALSQKVKLDMKQAMEQLKKLGDVDQIVIISQINALYEKQQRDETYAKDPPPKKTA